jgi:transposase
MLKWEEQMKIKFLVSRGHSIRETARLTGQARSTVRGVLRGKTEGGTGTETPGPEIKLADFKDYLWERYSKPGLSGTRLTEEHPADGFRGIGFGCSAILQTVDREGDLAEGDGQV